MGKSCTVLLACTLIAVPSGAQPYATANQEHVHKAALKKKFLTGEAWAKVVAGAAWSHLVNSPHEWGRGAGAFGKRVASSAGGHAVKGVVEYSIAASWTHEDLRYRRSNAHGTWPRLRYAVVHTFWVPRDTGGNTFAFGRTIGALTSGQVSRAWMPARVATVGAGFESGGLSICLDIGINVLQEFWPRRH